MAKRQAQSKKQQRANYLAQQAGFTNAYRQRQYLKRWSPKQTVGEYMWIDRIKGLRGEKRAEAILAHRKLFGDKRLQTKTSPIDYVITEHKYNSLTGKFDLIEANMRAGDIKGAMKMFAPIYRYFKGAEVFAVEEYATATAQQQQEFDDIVDYMYALNEALGGSDE